MTTSNALDISSQGQVYFNGTGVFSAPTITQHAPIIADAANNIKSTAVMANGQLLIGSNGADPVPASVTAGSGIIITPGPGTLSIAATAGGVTWVTVSSDVPNMTVETGYFVVAPGGDILLGLPTISSLGDILRVCLSGATSWTITQGIGQQIVMGDSMTTLGLSGGLQSTNSGDCVELVCRTPNLVWVVQSSMGNIGIA
jgi:hypothetical protein